MNLPPAMEPYSPHEIDSFARHIFAPDPLSRFQYENAHQSRHSSPRDQALKALMLAVLEDGIACFQSYFFQPSRTNSRLFQEAEEWINSEDDGIFSFNSICETLDLDPARLRNGLQRWRARQGSARPEKRKRLVPNKGKWPSKKNKAA
ncbi:MAG: hypothetical protein HYV04_14835 [Deltaproteobacteria bacterium]|nr:hypothetical protein [Deltaproteobacteria bacterium]